MVDLDTRLRESDFERWASSRLAATERQRSDLTTLYAFEAELAAIPLRVSQPILAEMRFTWWSEQMDGVFSGRPRKGHPVLERLGELAGRADLDRQIFDGLITARVDQVYGRADNAGAIFVTPMLQAVSVLVGTGYDAAAKGAAEVWKRRQQGDVEGAWEGRAIANQALRDLPVAAFPAVAHAALRSETEPQAVKRLRLVGAALLGRI
ncbi:MAG: squalene/phytoene synthase family protein [Caulobacterales bacterium]|nr:squalene/phytoene synthase family protein [Caulobacterales bacterium]